MPGRAMRDGNTISQAAAILGNPLLKGVEYVSLYIKSIVALDVPLSSSSSILNRSIQSQNREQFILWSQDPVCLSTSASLCPSLSPSNTIVRLKIITRAKRQALSCPRSYAMPGTAPTMSGPTALPLALLLPLQSYSAFRPAHTSSKQSSTASPLLLCL